MSDREQMQADAVSRAKDMYRRSQTYNMSGLPTGYNGNMRENQNNSHQNKPQQNQPPKNSPPQQNNTNNTNNTNAQNSSVPDTEQTEQSTPQSATERQSPQNSNIAMPSVNNQGNDFLEAVFQDKERALIILLIALLGEERANTSLMLALMYLMM